LGDEFVVDKASKFDFDTFSFASMGLPRYSIIRFAVLRVVLEASRGCE
jgi:hypothetical protein